MQREVADLDARVIFNPEWESGMGSSLRCGVERAEEAERVLLLLSDQPRLSLAVLQALLQANTSAGSPITASRYAGRLGVPAIFRKALYPELKSIKGDQGARQVIERHRGQVSCIDFPGGATDLDTAEDLALLEATFLQ
jgi:molybdenum cofactor cytidylyltransferase